MVKKIRFLVLGVLIFIFSNKITAQTFQAGLIGGINLSQLHGDGLAGFNQIGINVGGRVAITPRERWMYSLDLAFSQKGSNKSTDDSPAIEFQSFRLNYTEAALMASFLDWLEEDSSDEFYKLHFHGGVAWGRLLGFKVEDIFGQDISDNEDFNKNMVDLLLGATFFINKNFGINGQYSYTVNNVRKNKDMGALQGRTLTFRALYMF